MYVRHLERKCQPKERSGRWRYITQSFGLPVLHISDFSERDATTSRKMEENVPSAGEPTE
jgi:hypothetical protein